MMLCAADDDLENRSILYRVPVSHVVDPPNLEQDGENLNALANEIGENHSIVVHMRAHSGTKLFLGPNAEDQDSFGPIFIPPACFWSDLRGQWKDWLGESIEEEFEGLSYTFMDCIPFAKKNYSPDLWFVITAGPMTGKIGFWNHEEAYEENHLYADTLDEMIEKISQLIDEDEERLAAFDVNFYRPSMSIDQVPDGTECLYPVRYESSRE